MKRIESMRSRKEVPPTEAEGTEMSERKRSFHVLVMLHGLVELEAGFRESAVVFCTTVGSCVVSEELKLFLTSCNASLRVAFERCRQ